MLFSKILFSLLALLAFNVLIVRAQFKWFNRLTGRGRNNPVSRQAATELIDLSERRITPPLPRSSSSTSINSLRRVSPVEVSGNSNNIMRSSRVITPSLPENVEANDIGGRRRMIPHFDQNRLAKLKPIAKGGVIIVGTSLGTIATFEAMKSHNTPKVIKNVSNDILLTTTTTSKPVTSTIKPLQLPEIVNPIARDRKRDIEKKYSANISSTHTTVKSTTKKYSTNILSTSTTKKPTKNSESVQQISHNKQNETERVYSVKINFNSFKTTTVKPISNKQSKILQTFSDPCISENTSTIRSVKNRTSVQFVRTTIPSTIRPRNRRPTRYRPRNKLTTKRMTTKKITTAEITNPINTGNDEEAIGIGLLLFSLTFL